MKPPPEWLAPSAMVVAVSTSGINLVTDHGALAFLWHCLLSVVLLAMVVRR